MLGIAIFCYLLLTVLIGLFASRLVKSTKDFVLASRHLPIYLCTSAMFATWFGSETILGASARFSEEGIQGIIEEPLGAALCLVLVGVLIARPLYRMNLLTINDFYKRRFGTQVEWISSVLMILSYLGWIAAQLMALSYMLSLIFGIPQELSIWIGSAIVLVYTFFGGMWSISITDFMQTIMIVVGLAFLLLQLVIETPDISAVIQAQPEGFFNILPESSFSGWILYVSAWITIGLGAIPQQDVFQRVMSAKSEKVAVLSSYASGFLYLTIASIPLAIGLLAGSLHPELMAQAEYLIPTLVMKTSSPLVQFLFFGALISAILSTASGAILAPATILGENILKPFCHKLSDKKFLWIIRGCLVVIVMMSIGLSLSHESIFDLVTLSSSLSLVSLFVPLMAGLYWKKAHTQAALWSMLTGFFSWLIILISPYEDYAAIVGLSFSILGMYLVGTFKPSGSSAHLNASDEQTSKSHIPV